MSLAEEKKENLTGRIESEENDLDRFTRRDLITLFGKRRRVKRFEANDKKYAFEIYGKMGGYEFSFGQHSGKVIVRSLYEENFRFSEPDQEYLKRKKPKEY